MKQFCYALIGILVCAMFVPPGHAQQEEVEIQFGAFNLRSAAQKCVEQIAPQVRRPVYISLIHKSRSKYFYTVRSGPFESAQAARTFIRDTELDVPITAWIMARNALEPAVRREFPLGPASGSPGDSTPGVQMAAGRSPEPEPSAAGNPGPENPEADGPDTAQAETESSPGLWGTGDAESKEAESGTDGPGSPDVRQLQQQVRDLQEQVKTLMEAEEVRSALKESEEEEQEKQEDILSAAGRNYTLLRKGKLGLEYQFEYAYYPYDVIREQNIIEHNSHHNITNRFTLEYPLKNNLSLEAVIPFVYEYDKTGAEDSKNVSDFGDVEFAANYQPIKSGGGFPSIIFRTVLTTPMGRSPYDIDPETELATGSGGYALEGSMSVSKPVDPVMVFGTLGYTYKHPIRNLDYKLQSGATLERYDRGDSVELSMGLGYSLSYKTSLTLGYSYVYTFEAKRYFKESEPQTSPTRASSSISIGTSWRISPKFRINMSLGIDITDSHYHSLSFRFPFEYNL